MTMQPVVQQTANIQRYKPVLNVYYCIFFFYNEIKMYFEIIFLMLMKILKTEQENNGFASKPPPLPLFLLFDLHGVSIN